MEAERLDRLALATATGAEARADALVGLVADAVGRHELGLARDRLGPAAEHPVAVTGDYAEWRIRVRLAWVSAETALLAGEAASAVGFGRTAHRISHGAKACRHAVKSTLVLGVALDAAGRTRVAVRVLRTASRGATRLGLTPLLPPTHRVLAGPCGPCAASGRARTAPRPCGAKRQRRTGPGAAVWLGCPTTDRPSQAPDGATMLPMLSLHHPDGLQSRGRCTSRGVMHDQLRPALRRIPVTSVLICDERRGVRDGLAHSSCPSYRALTGSDTVASGDDMLERYPRERPDVVLVGTQRAVDTGIVLTRRLVSRHPRACVLVFGAADDTANIVAAVACGARGYLRWDASHAEVCAALAHALAGVELAGAAGRPGRTPTCG